MRHRMTGRLGWLTLLMTCLAGCVNPYRDARLGATEVPGDFALVFTVRGLAAAETRLESSAQYIVEPNRSLRVAAGTGAVVTYYPDLTRVLTPSQYQQIYALAQTASLAAQPESPGAERLLADASLSGVLYDVRLRAAGVRHHFRGIPAECPAGRELLAALVKAADWQPLLPLAAPITVGEAAP